MDPNLKLTKYPDGNPKTLFGSVKPGIWYVPPGPLFLTSLVHLQGALKYGHYNWRDDPVSASTYIDAAIRHILDWQSGIENASDTKLHNLSHASACLNIVMDAQLSKTLIDDRKKSDHGYNLEELLESLKPTVARIRNEWADFAEKMQAKKKEEENASSNS